MKLYMEKARHYNLVTYWNCSANEAVHTCIQLLAMKILKAHHTTVHFATLIGVTAQHKESRLRAFEQQQTLSCKLRIYVHVVRHFIHNIYNHVYILHLKCSSVNYIAIFFLPTSSLHTLENTSVPGDYTVLVMCIHTSLN